MWLLFVCVCVWAGARVCIELVGWSSGPLAILASCIQLNKKCFLLYVYDFLLQIVILIISVSDILRLCITSESHIMWPLVSKPVSLGLKSSTDLQGLSFNNA